MTSSLAPLAAATGSSLGDRDTDPVTGQRSYPVSPHRLPTGWAGSSPAAIDLKKFDETIPVFLELTLTQPD